MTSSFRTTNHTFPAFTLLLYCRRRYYANRTCFLPRVSAFSLKRSLVIHAREVARVVLVKWEVICLARIKRTWQATGGVECYGAWKRNGTWVRNTHLRARKCTFKSISRGCLVACIWGSRWISVALRNCPNGMLWLSLSRASQWYNVTRLSVAVEI